MPMMMGTSGIIFGWVLGAMVVAAAGVVISRWRAQTIHDNGRGSVDPLTTARERYARGDISKEEFEHMTERLLRTEHHRP